MKESIFTKENIESFLAEIGEPIEGLDEIIYVRASEIRQDILYEKGYIDRRKAKYSAIRSIVHYFYNIDQFLDYLEEKKNNPSKPEAKHDSKPEVKPKFQEFIRMPDKRFEMQLSVGFSQEDIEDYMALNFKVQPSEIQAFLGGNTPIDFSMLYTEALIYNFTQFINKYDTCSSFIAFLNTRKGKDKKYD